MSVPGRKEPLLNIKDLPFLRNRKQRGMAGTN